MEITQTLLRLKPGETEIFSLNHKASVITVCTRLKKSRRALFKTRRSEDNIKVTRVLDTFHETPSEAPKLLAFKRMVKANESLTWLSWDMDPADRWEIALINRTTLKSPVRIIPGESIPELVKILADFTEKEMNRLKPR